MRTIYKGKKIVAIIPARKGSKGLPNKNIKLLKGKPLIEHSIEQAKKVEIIDKIIVSTDSEAISRIAERHDIEMKGLRPEDLSGDQAIIYDVCKYEINHYQLVEASYEIMVLLQPTSPLRKAYMIEDALKAFIDKNQKSAVSISEVEEHPLFMRTVNEKSELETVLDMSSTVRRQDLPLYYKVNGMIYINQIDEVVNGYVSFNDNKSPIIIPKEYAVDIDTEEDLRKVEKMMTD